jgi:hypothetical protein
VRATRPTTPEPGATGWRVSSSSTTASAGVKRDPPAPVSPLKRDAAWMPVSDDP